MRIQAFLVAVLLAVPAEAQPKAPPLVIRGCIYPGQTLEKCIAQVLGEVRRHDADGNGLDDADVKLAEQRRAAIMRANRLQKFLAADIDGDLRLTADESSKVDNDYSSAYPNLIKGDTNSDSVITFEEAHRLAFPVDQLPYLTEIFELAAGASRVLTLEMTEKIARDWFAKIDSDSDGVISQAEHAAWKQTQR